MPGPTAPPRGFPAGRAAASPRCSAVDHSRIATPGASRPARPARCSAAAREIRSVVSRVSPVDGSSRGARRQPPSTTIRTPGTVSEVSAIEVASTTRRPSAGRNARSCSAGGRSPCSGSTSAPQPASAACVRRISAMPGRKVRMSPSCSASAARTARGHRLGQVARAGDVARGMADIDREHAAGAFGHLAPPSVRRGGRHRWSPTWRSAAAPAAACAAGRGTVPVPGRIPASARALRRGSPRRRHRARVRLQPADQQALGDHLDARGR